MDVKKPLVDVHLNYLTYSTVRDDIATYHENNHYLSLHTIPNIYFDVLDKS